MFMSRLYQLHQKLAREHVRKEQAAGWPCRRIERSAMRQLVLMALTALGAGAAMAQDIWDEPAGIETSGSAALGLSYAGDGWGRLDYHLRLGGEANYVLESGLEIGARGEIGVQSGLRPRAGFGGILEPVGPPGSGNPGAFSGLARGADADDRGGELLVEAAYLYAEGGYGEVRLGQDYGIGERFFESGPQLFQTAMLINADFDPTGLALIRTEADFTGPALRASYASPRLLGLRAGLSYAAQSPDRDLVRDGLRSADGDTVPRADDIFELGLNLSRRLPVSGVRLRGALGWSTASVSRSLVPGEQSRLEVFSAGGSVAVSDFEFGASGLSSNNGFRDGGRYTAWTASAAYDFGHFRLVGEYGEARDRRAAIESDSWNAGISRKIHPGITLAGGWRRTDTRLRGDFAAAIPERRVNAEGIVIEITLQRE
jgi:predicted porin